jgi:flagellar hook-associated protein 2
MSIINSNFRISGLASGLDTDQIVRDLMTAEKVPLTKLEQQRQLAEWRQEAYREFTNALRGFKEKFFDITKRTTYLLSDNAFKVFKTTSTGEDYVTVSGKANAEAGSHSIKVIQLATADKAVSNKPVSKPVTGEVTDFNLAGQSILVSLDGVIREIELADYDDLEDLIGDPVNGLQKLIDNAFGAGKIAVDESSGKLQLSTTGGASKLQVFYGTNGTDGLNSLGISNGASNRILTAATLVALKDQLSEELVFDGNGNVSFKINDASFTFSQNDTLSSVMAAINNSTEANVTIKYDEVTDTFSITAKQTGAGDNIRISETSGNFLSAIGITGITSEGVDAIAEIDREIVTRSSNTFTVNDIEYTLKKAHDPESDGETVTLEQNIDAVVDTIKTFVEEYNKLVDMFSSKLSEKYDRNYLPLSSEQKEALSDKEVELWEKKAKTGLLRNDSILQEIQNDMRMALLEPVEGVGISLSSIGITSKSYQDKGKLYIDEDKLRQAIMDRPDEVKNLFKKQSQSVPSYTRDLGASDRKTRYKEQGLLWRLSDIIEDNISILRDKDGKKGVLLEKAGMEGDTSEFNSSLSKDISSFDERITELYKKLVVKEANYYNQFTQLEKYMHQMNTQTNWLLSQFSNTK